MWHPHTQTGFFCLKNVKFESALFWLRCTPLALRKGHNPFFVGKKTGCQETARFFLVKKRVVWLGTDNPFFYQKKTVNPFLVGEWMLGCSLR